MEAKRVSLHCKLTHAHHFDDDEECINKVGINYSHRRYTLS